MPPVEEIDDDLAAEAEELDGYFSDAPLDPQPVYPALNERFDTAIVITNLPKVPESKLEKLTKVVMKLVSKIGTLQATDEFSGVMMPMVWPSSFPRTVAPSVLGEFPSWGGLPSAPSGGGPLIPGSSAWRSIPWHWTSTTTWPTTPVSMSYAAETGRFWNVAAM